jgi:hypothetical protein
MGLGVWSGDAATAELASNMPVRRYSVSPRVEDDLLSTTVDLMILLIYLYKPG